MSMLSQSGQFSAALLYALAPRHSPFRGRAFALPGRPVDHECHERDESRETRALFSCLFAAFVVQMTAQVCATATVRARGTRAPDCYPARAKRVGRDQAWMPAFEGMTGVAAFRGHDGGGCVRGHDGGQEAALQRAVCRMGRYGGVSCDCCW